VTVDQLVRPRTFSWRKPASKGGPGKIVWTDPFHPGFFLKITQPEDGDISGYARVENFETALAWATLPWPEWSCWPNIARFIPAWWTDILAARMNYE
jgi:hypothetical protein